MYLDLWFVVLVFVFAIIGAFVCIVILGLVLTQIINFIAYMSHERRVEKEREAENACPYFVEGVEGKEHEDTL